ncbi:hypothetical protein A4X13_0g5979 [Tilletia indica]|uniref:Uncharacterized protein n=1 Tax=Tilletia indica TaxID=43049 RepID=A0A177TG72_9BASI|nr:hypothetical protein A4X13_0g5979 [Tilletia indica]
MSLCVFECYHAGMYPQSLNVVIPAVGSYCGENRSTCRCSAAPAQITLWADFKMSESGARIPIALDAEHVALFHQFQQFQQYMRTQVNIPNAGSPATAAGLAAIWDQPTTSPSVASSAAPLARQEQMASRTSQVAGGHATSASSSVSSLSSAGRQIVPDLSRSVLLAKEQRQQAGVPPKGQVGKMIKLYQDEVIFLPERLIHQDVNLKDPKMMKLLSERGCKVKVRLPLFPGTAQAIMRGIKDAFLKQKHPLDLDPYKVEFAFLSGKNFLAPLPLAADQVDAASFEIYYEKNPCVLVTTIDAEDPEFHSFKRMNTRIQDQEAPLINDDSDEFGDAEDDLPDIRVSKAPPRPSARPVKPKGKANNPITIDSTTDSVDPFEDNVEGPSSNESDPELLAGRCFRCCAPLPLEDGPGNRVELAHDEVCPRKDCTKLTFVSVGGSSRLSMPLVSAANFPEDLGGMHESVMPFILQKKREIAEMEEKYGAYVEEFKWDSDSHATPDRRLSHNQDQNATEGKSGTCPCGEPDSEDDMIQCEACPVVRWYHYRCANIQTQPSTRWRCVECRQSGRDFWKESPPSQGKKRQQTDSHKGHKRQRTEGPSGSSKKQIIIPHRAPVVADPPTRNRRSGRKAQAEAGTSTRASGRR